MNQHCVMRVVFAAISQSKLAAMTQLLSSGAYITYIQAQTTAYVVPDEACVNQTCTSLFKVQTAMLACVSLHKPECHTVKANDYSTLSLPDYYLGN